MDHHGIPDPATVPWRYRGTYTTNTAPDVVCGDYLPPIDWSAPDAPPIADILAEIDQTMKQRTEWYAPKPAEDVVPPVEPDLGDHPITETPSQ